MNRENTLVILSPHVNLSLIKNPFIAFMLSLNKSGLLNTSLIN